MARIREQIFIDASTGIIREQYFFKCPACGEEHQFNKIVWRFNGDLEKPTLLSDYLTTKKQGTEEFICHSFIIDGSIRYLGDCSHEFKNLMLDLPIYTPEAPIK